MAGNVRSIHARAKALMNEGDAPQAEELLLQAREMAADADELALIDGTLAYAEAEQGRTSIAEQRCLVALRSPGLSNHSAALLRGQLGALRMMSGTMLEGVELLSAAVPHLTGHERTNVLINRGVAHLFLGNHESARQDFLAGLEDATPLEKAKLENNLGYVDLLRGDVVAALESMERARQTAEGLAAIGLTAVFETDRAEALGAAGLRKEAIGLLRHTREKLRDTDLWRFQGDAELRLAQLLDGPVALEHARRAQQLFTDHGNLVEADHAQSLALQILARRDAPPAQEELTEVADRLADAGRTASAQELRIRAAGLRGDMPEPVDDSVPLTTRLLAGEVGAAVALAKGDTTEALRRAGAAIDELENWQRSIGSLELQASTLTLGGDVIGVGQRAALACGDPAALLEWSERAREVASRGVPSRPPEELGDLLAQLRHLGPDGAAEQRARLIEQIRHGRWHAGGSVTSVHGITLASLQASLGDHRFVSLLGIGGEVVGLVVDADDVRVHCLGPKQEFDTQVTGLAADLAVAAQSSLSVVRRGLHERLATMDALLQPALAGAREVVLTMRGEWARVPWGQLESLRGAAVALPVSATAWVRAQEHRATPPRSVAVVVGPDTHTGKQEADAIADAWTDHAATTVLPAATCDQVRELAGDVDVLHISAHGRDRDGHRLFAATELHDGEWFGHDIELLAGVPDIVVLSACGVGGGSLGMARAWLHAGARYVIASPADISEEAAAERFPRMHALLAAGVSPERAVAEAFGPDALDCTVQCYGPPPLA